MAAYGIPEADIARVLGVSKPTLRKHCGTELNTGATRANSKVADFLFYGICGGTGKPAFKDERARVTAAIFWMKTRGGWSETSTHKHTGAANGDPIEVEVVTVRERLTRRIARIAAARTTGDVPKPLSGLLAPVRSTTYFRDHRRAALPRWSATGYANRMRVHQSR